MITVVTEGIFSYCGVKVKIDTDRHLGPECAPVRVNGEQIGHVTTAEYGSQMLSLGGVRHLTGGSKKEGRVTCESLLALCNCQPVEVEVDGGARVVIAAGQATGHQRAARGTHAGRLRICHHRHVRQAVAWTGRRGGRGRRSHHRRSLRAPGGKIPRRSGNRHPHQGPPLHAGPLFQGGPARHRLGRHRSDRPARHPEALRCEDGVAGSAPLHGLDHRRALRLFRTR